MPAVKVPIRVIENGVKVTICRKLLNVRPIDSFDYTHQCEVIFKGEHHKAYLNRKSEWIMFVPHPPISPAPTQAFDAFRRKYLTGLFH